MWVSGHLSGTPVITRSLTQIDPLGPPPANYVGTRGSPWTTAVSGDNKDSSKQRAHRRKLPIPSEVGTDTAQGRLGDPALILVALFAGDSVPSGETSLLDKVQGVKYRSGTVYRQDIDRPRPAEERI